MSDMTDLDALLGLTQRARAPRGIMEAGRRERFGDSPVPRRGQIWRAVQGDVSLLVLLIAADSIEAHVVPVTVDPSAEDAESVVLDASATALGVAATVWMGLRRTIPCGSLDAVVDELPLELASAVERPEVPFPKIRCGALDDSVYVTAARVRAELVDDLRMLAEAAS